MKILFFSPFANIWEHSFPEALVGEAFRDQGIDVAVVRCDRMFQEHCVAMSAAGVGPEAPLHTREQVCRACIKRRDLLGAQTGLSTYIMDRWIDGPMRERVEAIVAGATPTTWTGIEVEGVPLGRYAAYETWINNKLLSTELVEPVWSQYRGQLRNTLFAYFCAERIVSEQRPDAVIVYNDHYSVNHAFSAAARRAGIASYTIHGGNHMERRAETLSILASDYTMEDAFRSEAWAQFRSHPIDQAEVDLVGTHLSALLAANSAFVYSSRFEGTGAAELRTRLGIASDARVLLAAMSSEDELLAVRLIDAVPETSVTDSLFADQFEWVDHLFGYARAHPDTHLVFRLHPRMFPNKRESVLSPVVSRIMALRDDAPANITFNMPSDGIGLYDLMQVVDVLLNFRSSVGAELASMGIPVVVPANADFFTYPGEINRVGRTVEEYSAQIDTALAEGWSLENTRRAFRWFAFLFGRIAVDFSDAVTSRPVAIRPRKPGVRLWLWRKFVWVVLQYGPLVRERLALRNRSIAPGSRAVFLDVVEHRRESSGDSDAWPAITADAAAETTALESYLLALCDGIWKDIVEPDSLAGRIRQHLRPVARDRAA